MKINFVKISTPIVSFTRDDADLLNRTLTADDIIEWEADLRDDLDQFQFEVNNEKTRAVMTNIVMEWLYRLEMHYGIKIPLEVIDGTNNIQN